MDIRKAIAKIVSENHDHWYSHPDRPEGVDIDADGVSHVGHKLPEPYHDDHPLQYAIDQHGLKHDPDGWFGDSPTTIPHSAVQKLFAGQPAGNWTPTGEKTHDGAHIWISKGDGVLAVHPKVYQFARMVYHRHLK